MSTALKQNTARQLPTRRRHLALKRIFDTTLVLASAPITLPAATLTAVMVRWNMGSPVLFRQQRVGLDEQTFELLKFRSMLPEKDTEGNSLSEGERITTFGRLLRSSSMDELPQLLNVLRGEMSLVGPRPLLLNYLPYYRPAERARHSVRPGITGAAQVNGRNNLDWEGRLLLDAHYAQTAGLGQDLKILWQTFTSVLRSEGTVADSWEHFEDFDDYRSYPVTDTHALRRFEPRDVDTLAGWLQHTKVPAAMRLSDTTTVGIGDWLRDNRQDSDCRTLAVYDHQARVLRGITGYHTPTPGSLPQIFLLPEAGQEDPNLADTILGLLLKYLRKQENSTGATAEVDGTRRGSTGRREAAELYRRHGFQPAGEDPADVERWEIRW